MSRLAPILAPMRQFIVFCGVGGAVTLAGLGIILYLSEILHMNYAAANAIGYAAGFAASFTLHRLITFRDARHGRPIGRQVARFLLVFCAGYAVQLLALHSMVTRMGIPNAPAQIAAMALYTLVSFAGNRALTFGNKKK